MKSRNFGIRKSKKSLTRNKRITRKGGGFFSRLSKLFEKKNSTTTNKEMINTNIEAKKAANNKEVANAKKNANNTEAAIANAKKASNNKSTNFLKKFGLDPKIKNQIRLSNHPLVRAPILNPRQISL